MNVKLTILTYFHKRSTFPSNSSYLVSKWTNQNQTQKIEIINSFKLSKSKFQNNRTQLYNMETEWFSIWCMLNIYWNRKVMSNVKAHDRIENNKPKMRTLNGNNLKVWNIYIPHHHNHSSSMGHISIPWP